MKIRAAEERLAAPERPGPHVHGDWCRVCVLRRIACLVCGDTACLTVRVSASCISALLHPLLLSAQARPLAALIK
eukprot:CAMPEP_0183349156 /NCGR_PEP_ID=MMETSP0164_2-20130417/13431_1 /TAXON_ID=221442 /ORGANISM="Coccolithus pelagicus ssp braarudi, Strain PLY182g" /LENGTH=74 /DNA_ID=CAMNT_0025520837 /DNA_START=194 /DNA_END=418 /DNA_ORIENTATION=+